MVKPKNLEELASLLRPVFEDMFGEDAVFFICGMKTGKGEFVSTMGEEKTIEQMQKMIAVLESEEPIRKVPFLSVVKK